MLRGGLTPAGLLRPVGKTYEHRAKCHAKRAKPLIDQPKARLAWLSLKPGHCPTGGQKRGEAVDLPCRFRSRSHLVHASALRRLAGRVAVFLVFGARWRVRGQGSQQDADASAQPKRRQQPPPRNHVVSRTPWRNRLHPACRSTARHTQAIANSKTPSIGNRGACLDPQALAAGWRLAASDDSPHTFLHVLMTNDRSSAGAAWSTLKAALGFRRRDAAGTLPQDPGSAASIQRLSSTLAEVSMSLAAMRRQIDELHGRR